VKIPLHILASETVSVAEAQAKAVERDVLAVKKGDYAAQQSLLRTFAPLITSIAQKRTTDPAMVKQYIDAGKEGLLKAARKYTHSMGAEKFQFLALDCIQGAMDRSDGGGGFFSRLFGR
jgi:DNA-directed RNA polymerase specialized sigma subunit